MIEVLRQASFEVTAVEDALKGSIRLPTTRIRPSSATFGCPS